MRGPALRWRWAALGALLSLGSPLGAGVLRAVSGRPPSLELQLNGDLYAYMAIGTGLAFAAFGWSLGQRADELAEQRRALRVANRRLRWLSSIDALTGVLNRRALDRRLEEEVSRARREDRPLSVAMIDIDRFKAVNDAHGHAVGDRVLRIIARRLQRGARATDVLGRYGGEEFLLLLPSSDRDEAFALCERLRGRISGRPIAGNALTASFGIATVTPPIAGRSAQLVERADAAMYRAKAAGRDRVVAAD